MNVRCERCTRFYDDEHRWTICPHSPLGCGVDDLCPKCDSLKSVHGPCRHQTKTEVVEVMSPISTPLPTPGPTPRGFAPHAMSEPVPESDPNQPIIERQPCDECGQPLPRRTVHNIYGAFCSIQCIGKATDRKRAARHETVIARPLYLQEQVNDWLEANDKKPHEVLWVTIPADLMRANDLIHAQSRRGSWALFVSGLVALIIAAASYFAR